MEPWQEAQREPEVTLFANSYTSILVPLTATLRVTLRVTLTVTLILALIVRE